MKYTICTQPVNPQVEALPIYKITDYPLETRDYKPLAHVRICLTPTELLVQLWAFEMFPKPESKLLAVFTTEQSDALLFVECLSNGEVSCRLQDPSGTKPCSVLSHSLCGEDLIGVYWGASVKLPRSLLETIFGPNALELGSSLCANFYKLSDNAEKPHKGSMYPADFKNHREYALPSLAKFNIVDY